MRGKEKLSADSRPNVPRSNASREVVREADKILREVRARALYLIPFRLMLHLPGRASLIRPVDTVRVSYIGAGIGTTGFRRHEPCCVSDPIPEFGLRRYVIGGNHRSASTRDSGQVLVPTNRISSKHFQKLMRLLKQEDELLIRTGVLESHCSDEDQAMRCLEILAVTLQGLEPAPKPLTCLQQVQLLRTAARNDPAINFVHARASSYGAVSGLRARIFPADPGTDDSTIHFLLNNKMGPRHKNKLLAGAKVLIATESAFTVPAIADRKSLLDILIHWEAKGQISPFLDTHLSYIGPMTTEALHAIMEFTRVCIEEGNVRTTPFNTSAFRQHVGGAERKRKRGSKNSKDASPAKKLKSKPSIAKKPKQKPISRLRNAKKNLDFGKYNDSDSIKGLETRSVMSVVESAGSEPRNTVSDAAADRGANTESETRESSAALADIINDTTKTKEVVGVQRIRKEGERSGEGIVENGDRTGKTSAQKAQSEAQTASVEKNSEHLEVGSESRRAEDKETDDNSVSKEQQRAEVGASQLALEEQRKSLQEKHEAGAKKGSTVTTPKELIEIQNLKKQISEFQKMRDIALENTKHEQNESNKKAMKNLEEENKELRCSMEKLRKSSRMKLILK